MTLQTARLGEDGLARVRGAHGPIELCQPSIPLGDIDAVGIGEPLAELGMLLFEPGDPALAVVAERLPCGLGESSGKRLSQRGLLVRGAMQGANQSERFLR